MEPNFWHQKWKKNEIGFHEGKPNSLLVKHFPILNLRSDSRVFLPLCGKTQDLTWLREQGYRTVGAELNESAVQALFEGLSLTPKVTTMKDFKLFTAENIEIYVGNVFRLSAPTLGEVHAIYDRAALVALPGETRVNYTSHLKTLTGNAPQLLITFHYRQEEMNGPPFSISPQEVVSLYGSDYEIRRVASKNVEGRLKGQVEAAEEARVLSPKPTP